MGPNIWNALRMQSAFLEYTSNIQECTTNFHSDGIRAHLASSVTGVLPYTHTLYNYMYCAKKKCHFDTRIKKNLPTRLPFRALVPLLKNPDYATDALYCVENFEITWRRKKNKKKTTCECYGLKIETDDKSRQMISEQENTCIINDKLIQYSSVIVMKMNLKKINIKALIIVSHPSFQERQS